MASLTECSLCLEEFEDPRLLPCSHTYCTLCLQDLVRSNNNGSICCPQCRQDTPLPQGGVALLPRNIFAEKLIENKYNNHEAQAECNSSVAGAADGGDNCMKHKTLLTLFCNNQTCQIAICASCVHTQHRDHNVMDLNEKVDQVKAEFKQITDESLKCRQLLNEYSEELACVSTDIDTTTLATLDMIDDAKEKLLNRILVKSEKFKFDTIQNQQMEQQNIKLATNEVERKNKAINDIQVVINAVMANDNPREIINNADLVHQALTHVTRFTNSPLTPAQSFNRKIFQPTFDVDLGKQLLGTLKDISSTLKCSMTPTVPSTASCAKLWEVSLNSQFWTHVKYIGNGEIVVAGRAYGFGGHHIKYYTLKGDNLRTIKTSGHVSGMCVIGNRENPYLVVTMENKKIEVRQAYTGEILYSLQLDKNVWGICAVDYDRFITATDSGPQTTLIECQITATGIIITNKDRKVNLKTVETMDIINDIGRTLIVMTSLNDQPIVAIDYDTGEQVWKTEIKYVDKMIQPSGICSDGHDHLYVADSENKRVLVVNSGGKILGKLLETDGKCQDVSYIEADRKLVVIYGSLLAPIKITVNDVAYV